MAFLIWVTGFDIIRGLGGGRAPHELPDALRPCAGRPSRVDVGGVLVGSAHPVVVQSMTNTDTADADATAIQVARLAHAGSSSSGSRSTTTRPRRPCRRSSASSADLGVGVPIIGDFHYNGHQLLVEYPEMAAAPRQVPDQPGQRRREAPRRELPDDRPGRDRERQAGPDRRQLGLARPGAADRADGRERALAPSPRDARDVMIEAMIESAMRSAELAEATGLRPRPDHPVGEGLRRPRPRRRLPAPRRALRLPAPPRPDRGGHGR